MLTEENDKSIFQLWISIQSVGWLVENQNRMANNQAIKIINIVWKMGDNANSHVSNWWHGEWVCFIYWEQQKQQWQRCVMQCFRVVEGEGGAFRMDDGLFINYKLNWAHVFQYLSMSLFGEWWGWCSVDEFINTVAFWTILRHKMHWPTHFINKNWPNLTPFMCAYLPFSAG